MKTTNERRSTEPKARVLAVDLDDVLFPFNELLCEFNRVNYGTRLRHEDIFTFDMQRVWGLSDAECRRRMAELRASPIFAEAYPLAGAREALIELTKEGPYRTEVHVVTSRSEDYRELTEAWLKFRFDGMIAGLHLTNQFHGERYDKTTKSRICMKIGASLSIDDCMDHVHDITQLGIPVLVFDRPWNRHENLPDRAFRVHSWFHDVPRGISSIFQSGTIRTPTSIGGH